jgi:hypothetical protein
MATTTNYSWTTPDDTALVKDGAAAIRTLGSSVDTTVKNLNPETTLGDIAYRSSTANVNTRLPLGTANQQLRVNSGATAPEWFTPAAAGGISWSLLNSGGTALTGAATITISGISGKNHLMIIVQNASSSNAGELIYLTFNSDTGGNYGQFGQLQTFNDTYSKANAVQSVASTAATQINFGNISDQASTSVSGYCLVSGTNTTASKIYQLASGSTSGNDTTPRVVGGYYTGSSTISSVSITSSGGNLDNGTIYVYASA